jgi:hypothetical protein
MLSSCYVAVQGSSYLACGPWRSLRIVCWRLPRPEASKALVRACRRRPGISRCIAWSFGYEKIPFPGGAGRGRLGLLVSACGRSPSTYLWEVSGGGSLRTGFFNAEEAEMEAARLKKKGLDVIVRPVDAFSTLGWFADPLFSFMSKYDDGELAETIIHELAHATVFVKRAEQFNEEFATFVGRQGALEYLKDRYAGSAGRGLLQRVPADAGTSPPSLAGSRGSSGGSLCLERGPGGELERKARVIAEGPKNITGPAASLFEGERTAFSPWRRSTTLIWTSTGCTKGSGALPELFRGALRRGPLRVRAQGAGYRVPGRGSQGGYAAPSCGDVPGLIRRPNPPIPLRDRPAAFPLPGPVCPSGPGSPPGCPGRCPSHPGARNTRYG